MRTLLRCNLPSPLTLTPQNTPKSPPPDNNMEEGEQVQWGEFQGTWAGGGEDGSMRGRQGLRHEDSWEAFRDDNLEETKMDGQGLPVSRHDGQWWCEASTELGPQAPEHYGYQNSLERVFEECFPSLPVQEVKDDVRPLEEVFSETLDLPGDQT
ncbi:uncharacterized protein O3C94_022618, partial [Discoglossus pictus]